MLRTWHFTTKVFVALLVCLVVGACGHVEPLMSLPPGQPGDGKLSQLELQTDCAGLKLAVERHLSETRRLQTEQEAELKQPAPTFIRYLNRYSGIEGQGTAAYEKIQAERQVLTVLSDRHTQLNCQNGGQLLARAAK